MFRHFLFCFVFLGCLTVSATEPIAVYLTWKDHPESSIVIRWITPIEDQFKPDLPPMNGSDSNSFPLEAHKNEGAILENITPSFSEPKVRASREKITSNMTAFIGGKSGFNSLFYRKKGENEWKSIMGTHRPFPEGHPYLIHEVLLENLSPQQEYSFCLNNKSPHYRFLTAPEELHEQIRFVVGGDFYHGSVPMLEKMNRQAAKFSPLFALVGGDIAYATPKDICKPENMQRWLDFIVSWTKTMVTPEGYLIPILAVIGNEDTKGRYDQTPDQAPFFYSLFGFSNDPGYRFINFTKNITIWLLDSGHTHPIDGAQCRWLYQSLEEHQETPFKFALYHVPAYPSVRTFHNRVSEIIRKYWVPSFEEFGLTAAFENHDHAYKRSHPIRNRKANPEGVIYLGDGGWSVYRPRIPAKPSQRWYLAYTAAKRNFIAVSIEENQADLMAIDDEGKIFDRIQIPAKILNLTH